MTEDYSTTDASDRSRSGPRPIEGSRGARRLTLWTGIGLAVLAFGTLYPGLSRVGITFDEPQYFRSASRIQDWVAGVVRGPDRADQLTETAIREVWDAERARNPHPPAYKAVMAATEATFGRWTGSIVGFRIAPLLFFSLVVATVAWVAGATWGGVAGGSAGLAVLLMPRLVGHAHIAATDMPLTAAWLIACCGLALFVSGGRRRYLILGAAALGFGMATKFTAYLIPVSMLLWMIPFGLSKRGLIGASCWVALGLAVAWVANPIAWLGPIAETGRLFAESLSREQHIAIRTYYMGKTWGYVVPRHHAFVMTLITVPLPILVLATAGAISAARRFLSGPIGALCLLQILFFFALMAAPGSPNHDGVRLWLPMFPFVALLAGRGFAVLLGELSRRLGGRRRLVAALAMATVFFVPPAVHARHVAPFYLSYYNELIGGLPGAAGAGMQVTYWLDAVTPAFLARVNDVVPEGSTLDAHPGRYHYEWLQRQGMLRSDIRISGESPADYLVLLARKSAFEETHWHLYRSVRPELAVQLDGVELVGLYAGTPATP